MKFMICQPMSGIEESVIWEQREEIRKFLESKGHELIDTFFMEEAPKDVKHPNIFYLGRAFNKGLCYADAIVLAPGWENARGCKIERETAYSYELDVYEFYKKGSKYYKYEIKNCEYRNYTCENDCMLKRNWYSAGTETVTVMKPNPTEII